MVVLPTLVNPWRSRNVTPDLHGEFVLRGVDIFY